MSHSWLRQLFKKKFLGARGGRIAPITHRLSVEELEARALPTTIWTGGAVPLPTTAAGDTSWGNPANWSDGVPDPGETVVFPAGLAAANKPPAVFDGNGVFQFPDPVNYPAFGSSANSTLDTDYVIGDLIILDDNYHIDAALGTTAILTIQGRILTDIPQNLGSLTGLSLIGPDRGATGLTVRLTSQTQIFQADNVGVLHISANIVNAPGVTGGIQKDGVGTISLAGNNTFTGGIQINQGTLIAASNNALGSTAGGTVVANGASVGIARGTVAESLVITGTGVNNAGALVQLANPISTFSGGQLPPGFPAPIVWSGGITLSPSASIGVGGLLTISTSGISGSGDLTKVGGGTLVMNVGNVYAGNTFIQQGTLQLRNDLGLSPNGVSGGFPGSATFVSNGAMLELFGNRTISERLFINGGGIPDNVGRAQGALHQLNGVSTYLADITLTGAASIGAAVGDFLLLSGLLDQTSGSVFDLSKVDAGNVRIATANPNFVGNTFVRDGTLEIAHPLALGPITGDPLAGGGGGITVTSTTGTAAAQGTLQLEGTYDLQKTLTLAGTGYLSSGAVHTVAPQGGGTTTITLPAIAALPFNISLAAATSIKTDGGTTLNLNGLLVGGALASFDKTGTGTLSLQSDNTYQGATTLRQGLTIITTGGALGTPDGDTTVFAGIGGQPGASLRLANALTVNNEVLNIAGTGQGNLGALQAGAGQSFWTGLVNLLGIQATRADFSVDAGGSLEFSNVVSGDADLHKIGAGELRLTGTAANTFTKGTFVDLGVLTLAKTAGINAVGGPVTVGVAAGPGNNTAQLLLGAADQIPQTVSGVPISVTVNETGLFNLQGFAETISSLTLTGGEVLTGGATLTLGGNVTTTASAEISLITGNVALGAAARTFTVADGTAPVDLQINGVLSGGTAITKAGPGLMRLNGVNTYGGNTSITGGTLQLGVSNAIPAATAVTISAGATFDVNGVTNTVAAVSGAGTLALGASTGLLTTGGNNTSQTLSGPITGAGGLTKVGTGALTLSGASPAYTGTTTVSGGTVFVNANQGAASVVVQAGSTLGGNGTVRGVTLNAGATLAPGATVNTTATLSGGTGLSTFNAGSNFIVDVNSATPGTGYDQFVTTGSVALNGATLTLNLNPAFTPALGTTFTLISATGLGGVTGTFSGPTTFTNGNRVYRLVYGANSVALNVIAFAANATLAPSVNPSAPGQSVTFTFTLAPASGTDPTPTGTVQFAVDGTNVGGPVTLVAGTGNTATASFMSSTLAIGSRTITAMYTPATPPTPPATGSPYAPVTATVTQSVKYNSTTALTALNSPSLFGAPASFRVVVTGTPVTGQPAPPVPTGMVTFVVAATGQVLGTAMLSGGQATFTTSAIPSGNVTIRADYSGDPSTQASSNTTIQVVSRQTRVAVGSDAGPLTTVQVFDPKTGALLATLVPFDTYTGGSKVAVGDINNDGISDIIVSAGAGAPGGHVKVFSGSDYSLIASFLTFPGFTGGVNIASGDVDGDGFFDVIVGTAIATDHVKAFSGRGLITTGNAEASTLMSFFAYSASGGNAVGVTVGAGDVDGDGRADVITGSAQAAGHVKVFQALSAQLIGSYLAYGAGYLGGIFVAGGDTNGDNRAEIVTGATNAPHVKVLTLAGTELASFLAYPGSPFGVRVGAVDRDGDGLADILTGAGGSAPHVKVFKGTNTSVLLDSFIANVQGLPVSRTGVFVAGS